MAQPGDTITYTVSLEREKEDISDVDEIEIKYVDGAGGEEGGSGSGGRVENVVVDVSAEDDLYLWVAQGGVDGTEFSFGRYFGLTGSNSGSSAGSTEISLLDTDRDDSDTEPFIAAAGGGGGFGGFSAGPGGARGGDGGEPSTEDRRGDGEPPVLGGTGGDEFGGDAKQDAKGAVLGHGSAATIIDSGTTIEAGGNAPGEGGEIRIAYVDALEPPEPPENLTAELL